MKPIQKDVFLTQGVVIPPPRDGSYSVRSFVPPRNSTTSTYSYVHSSIGAGSTIDNPGHYHQSDDLRKIEEKYTIEKKQSIPKLEASFLDKSKKGRGKLSKVIILLAALVVVVGSAVAGLLLASGGSSSSGSSSANATESPTSSPVVSPPATAEPTKFPTLAPTTANPTTAAPTRAPTTAAPTFAPTQPFPTEIFTPGDTIGILFDERVTPIPSAIKVSIQKAVARWNQITLGSAALFTPNVVISPQLTFCNGLFSFPTQLLADHIRLYVNVAPFDGPNGVTVTSGVCDLTNFPVVSLITIDSADVGLITSSIAIDNFFIREVGRGLGFGVLWKFATQGRINTDGSALIQAPVFDAAGVFFGSAQPQFIGLNAVAEFSILFGLNQPFVPVENAIFQGVALFPNQNQGLGIVDIFWDADFMPGESFEFRLFATSVISRVTIASLEDMGYKGNRALADAYFPFVASLRGETAESHESYLRSAIFYPFSL